MGKYMADIARTPIFTKTDGKWQEMAPVRPLSVTHVRRGALASGHKNTHRLG